MTQKPCLLSVSILACLVATGFSAEPSNPKIDYRRFVGLAASLQQTRNENRVSEEDFIRMAAEPGTVVLDARSRDKYENIHVKGAIHVAFTDFTEEALGKAIPDKATRILIYCNNNFDGDPVNLRSKSAPVALNIQTFINLHAYGYTNVRELAPLLDLKTTKIPFEGKTVTR